MNDIHLTEKLERAALSPMEQARLFALIGAVFERAIDARSPKKRPPGKAGLRAEKGYYRLLYLQGDFEKNVTPQEDVQSDAPRYDWDVIPGILNRLKDIPELQREISEGFEAAIEEAKGAPPDC